MQKEQIDYREMYLHMMQATEQALNILIAAQRECEERYLSAAGESQTDD